MASTPTPGREGFDPTSVIRSDLDATVILALWCLRKLFLPLLWFGFLFATTYYIVADREVALLVDQVSSLASPSEAIGALLSPLIFIVVASVMRISVGFVALAAAYPLSRSTTTSDHSQAGWIGRHMRVGRDRLYLSRAFRNLRWTWIVRSAAVERLGRRGQLLALCNSVIKWAGIILLAACIFAFFFAIEVAT